MESRQGSTTAAAGAVAMENGQLHDSDDSSSVDVDQLRAQLHEQVLPVLSHLSILFVCVLYISC